MDIHATRDPVDRDLRRRKLAQRLVVHRARTQTIFHLTGLSRHQMATLRRRWRVTEDMRHRGPPPRSFAVFWSTLRVRAEAATLAVVWRIHENLCGSSAAAFKQAAAIEFGERLCDVFEIYLACFPKSELELEHLMLLARGLEDGDAVTLSSCVNCQAAILIDLLGRRRPLCSHCVQIAESARDLPNTNPSSGGETPGDRTGEAVQQELF